MTIKKCFYGNKIICSELTDSSIIIVIVESRKLSEKIIIIINNIDE